LKYNIYIFTVEKNTQEGSAFPKHMLSAANYNTLGQQNIHSTFRISEGGALSKAKLNEALGPDWGEMSCYVKCVKKTMCF